MADVNAISELGSQMISKVFGSILWMGIGFIVVGVFVFLIWWFLVYTKKFDIKVKIISERSNDKNKIIFDKAAILKDRKTGTKFFKLWDSKVELPIPKFNVIQSSNKGDYIELYRKTEDEFYFLMSPRIDKLSLIKMDGLLHPIGEQEHKQLDADIAYWNVKRKDRNKSIFSQDTTLMKLLPYIPLLLGGVILIFILYVLMGSLPEIMGSMKELVNEMKELKGGQGIVVKSLIPLILIWYGQKKL